MELFQFVSKAIEYASILLDLWLQFTIYKFTKMVNPLRNEEEDIHGKCVVVTGGSSGIGKASAKEFARRGAIVVIGDVDLENGRKSVDEIRLDTGNMNVVNIFYIFSLP